MSLFKGVWDKNLEKAKIIFSDDFLSAHRVFQLDALQDAIFELKNKYIEILEEK